MPAAGCWVSCGRAAAGGRGAPPAWPATPPSAGAPAWAARCTQSPPVFARPPRPGSAPAGSGPSPAGSAQSRTYQQDTGYMYLLRPTQAVDDIMTGLDYLRLQVGDAPGCRSGLVSPPSSPASPSTTSNISRLRERSGAQSGRGQVVQAAPRSRHLLLP